jgi:hypothetical protein
MRIAHGQKQKLIRVYAAHELFPSAEANGLDCAAQQN